MDPRTRNPNSSRLLACLALLTGCNLSFDPSLIRDAGGGPAFEDTVVEDDASERPDREESAPDSEAPQPDAEAPRRDAEVPRDASGEFDAQQPALDAGGDAEPVVGPELDAELSDAQQRDVEVPIIIDPIIDAQVGCSRDSECAADSFCTAAGSCVGRCDEQRGCAGPRVAAAIAAAGDTLYWSTPVETDALGNPLNHGRIWSWRRSDPLSSVVQRDSGTLLFVIDDYIYLLRPAALGGDPTVLMRKWLGTADSPDEQLATGVRKVWTTRDHVVWSRTEAANEELWRLRRMPASSPERALITKEGHWTSSNATFAVKYVSYPGADPNSPNYRFVIVRLSDQVVHGIVEQDVYSQNEHSAADEDYFYFPRATQIKRAPFANLSQELILATGFISTSMRFVPNGGWLYWNAESTLAATYSGRTQRDALVPLQMLPLAPPYGAVIKNELFYGDRGEQRIFIKTMPPLPCSSAMPCPADMSCGTNMLCE